jgi:branched-chain amino acid transport system permease protein
MTAWLYRGINLPLTLMAAAFLLWSISVSDPYGLRLLTTAGVFATAVIGYQFIFGHAGALSLAQGTFFGLGAYATGITGSQFGWGFEITFLFSIALPVAVAAVVAAPVLRLESHYFALATLGIGQVVLLIAINWESLTGGANGIPGVPGISVFGLDVVRGWPLLAIVWGVAILAATTAWSAMRGVTGRAFALMRSDTLAAMSCGINIRRLRFQAFLLSAMFGGAAGALHVHTNRVISPDALEFHIMVTILAMTVVGGRTHIAGAFVGAVLLSHLAEWFRFLEHYYLLAYGILLLLMVVAAPWGIVGTAERVRRRVLPERAISPPSPIQIRSVETSIQGLEIRGLTKSFGGIRALDDVGLDVQPGEILGLIGPNGCGKTTLINLVTGLETADAGTIRWNGGQLNGNSPDSLARSGITRTFQSTRLVEEDTALDNIAIGRWEDGKGPSIDVARGEAMALLSELHAAEAAMTPVQNLTQSVRRRVEIARALATIPGLLFLDEPATGLSADEREMLAASIQKFAKDGLTLVVVDHDIEFLSEISHRIVCLDRGRVIASGSVVEIRRNAAVTSAYLSGASKSIFGVASDG